MPTHHFRELDTFYNFWLQRKFNINLLNCILKQRYNLKSETKEEPQPIQLYLLVKKLSIIKFIVQSGLRNFSCPHNYGTCASCLSTEGICSLLRVQYWTTKLFSSEPVTYKHFFLERFLGSGNFFCLQP